MKYIWVRMPDTNNEHIEIIDNPTKLLNDGLFEDKEVLRDASGHEIDELGRQ